jgi:hypothetical protein
VWRKSAIRGTDRLNQSRSATELKVTLLSVLLTDNAFVCDVFSTGLYWELAPCFTANTTSEVFRSVLRRTGQSGGRDSAGTSDAALPVGDLTIAVNRRLRGNRKMNGLAV